MARKKKGKIPEVTLTQLKEQLESYVAAQIAADNVHDATRPSTKTLRRVVAWLESQNLSVYGPCINFDAGVQTGACMDYDVEQILKLAKLNKRYPKGIPRAEYDD